MGYVITNDFTLKDVCHYVSIFKICMYIYVCVCVCVCIYIYVCVCVHLFTHFMVYIIMQTKGISYDNLQMLECLYAHSCLPTKESQNLLSTKDVNSCLLYCKHLITDTISSALKLSSFYLINIINLF